MRRLIEGLLRYSRIGKSGAFEPHDLNEILADVMNDLAVFIRERGAEINFPVLPTIRCLQVEMTRLFQNFISNALKFCPPERTPVIDITAAEKDTHWEFTISDNGIGIREENLTKIFAMFQKLHKEKIYKGYGIGLAFCEKIVELHGGTISVKSVFGTGTSFTFTIAKRK